MTRSEVEQMILECVAECVSGVVSFDVEDGVVTLRMPDENDSSPWGIRQ